MNHLKQLPEYNDYKAALKSIKSPDIFTNIITLKEHVREMAYDIGFNKGIYTEDLDKFVDEYINHHPGKIQEFVEISENYIKIGVDYDQITDEAVAHAMWLLSNTLTKK